jgi:predicted RNase H-like HicB family nuclease
VEQAILPLVTYFIDTEQEEDGRWIAEVPNLHGVMVYRQTEDEAMRAVAILAMQVITDRMAHGEIPIQIPISISFDRRQHNMC